MRGWKQFVVDAGEADQKKRTVKKAFACSKSDPDLPFLAQPPHPTFPPPLTPYLTPPLPLPITPPPLGPAPALAATAGGFLARRHALDVHPLHPPTHPPRRRQPPQAPQATTPQPVPAHPPPRSTHQTFPRTVENGGQYTGGRPQGGAAATHLRRTVCTPTCRAAAGARDRGEEGGIAAMGDAAGTAGWQ